MGEGTIARQMRDKENVGYFDSGYSPPKKKEGTTKGINAKEEGRCFRCLNKLSGDEKPIKGDLYCKECSKIMENVYRDERGSKEDDNNKMH